MLNTLRIGEDLPETVPTVVYLHGLFGQGRNFATIARSLLPQARGVLVDLPDHGRSPWSDRVDLAAMADAVAATVREEAATPVCLVGHSLGGKVAMLLALRHPELVDRLVVVDIAPVPSSNMSVFGHLLGALATLDLPSLESRSAADVQLHELIPDTTIRLFLLQNLYQHEGRWAWRANLDLLRRSLDVIGGFPDVGGATYDGKVLWVTGETSSYTSESDEEAMRALFARLQQVTVKGAGHWVHSEQPETFIQILKRFLTW